MKHLSGLDASFLHAETPETPMHVGAMVLVDPPEPHDANFYEVIKAHIASRLHLVEVFTRKLALMPFELSNPVWVDDEDIDIEHHVRRVTVSEPGTFGQLEALTARLHAMPLDRSRPLWEMVLIDGLESGKVAVYFKWHHAGVDGQGIVAFVQTVMDESPQGRDIRPPRAKSRRSGYQLGMAELAGAALSNTMMQYVKVAKAMPEVLGAWRNVVTPESDGEGSRPWKAPKALDLLAPKSILNVAITNQRSFAGRSIPLAESKQIAKSLAVSLNDVVLATCAGALRRFLIECQALPKKSLRAAVPMSLRAEGNTESNNQISMSVMNLATAIDDRVERLMAIHASSLTTKAMMGRIKAAIPTDFPSFGAPLLMSGLASLYGRSRLADTLPPIANLVISNVPGPSMPLYIAGGRVTAYFPVSIPVHGMALNMTVESYNGSLDYGLIACRRALPDVAALADLLVDEHKRLLEEAKMHSQPGKSAIAASALPRPVAALEESRRRAAYAPRIRSTPRAGK